MTSGCMRKAFGVSVLLFLPLLGQCGKAAYRSQRNRSPGKDHVVRSDDNICKKVLWFMTLRGSDDQSYNDYVKAALLSAQAHAPSLIPHLIWSGPPSPMTAWFEYYGGLVIFQDLSFFGKLPEHYRGPWSGTYLRYELPDIIASLVLKDDVDTKYVLYTDADVMFYQDITSCSIAKPAILAMGPEFAHNETVNAGVLYLNITAFAQHKEGLVNLGIEKGFGYFKGSQQLLLAYFGPNISRLPDAYNWKGYWGGPSEEADVAILHWHGPKPLGAEFTNITTAGGLNCFLANPLDIDTKCSHVYEMYRTVYKLTPDGGKYFIKVLQDFHLYLLKARAMYP